MGIPGGPGLSQGLMRCSVAVSSLIHNVLSRFLPESERSCSHVWLLMNVCTFVMLKLQWQQETLIMPNVILHYITLNLEWWVNNAEALQSLLKFTVKINYGMHTKNKWQFSLVLCREFDNINSAGKLFHVCAAVPGNACSQTVDSHIGGKSNAEVDDCRACRRCRPGFPATEMHKPGRQVQVHRHTGTPWRRAWRISTVAHKASAYGRAAG